MGSDLDTLSPLGAQVELSTTATEQAGLGVDYKLLPNGDIVVAGTEGFGNGYLHVSEYSSTGALLWDQSLYGPFDDLGHGYREAVPDIIPLSDGNIAVAWNTYFYPLFDSYTPSHSTNQGDYAVLTSSGKVVTTGTVDGGADASASGYATTDGGFVLTWDAMNANDAAVAPQYSQAYTASGQAAATGAYSNTLLPTAHVDAETTAGGALSVTNNQVSYAVGTQTWTTTLAGETAAQVLTVGAAALSNGEFALSWVDTAGKAWLDFYDPSTHALSAPVQIAQGLSIYGSWQDYVVALPDSGFLVSLNQSVDDGINGGSHRYEVFDSTGTQSGGWVTAPTAIQQLVNGQVAIGLGFDVSTGHVVEQSYTITSPGATTAALQASGTAAALPIDGSSAVALADGDVAIGYSGGFTVYDSAGARVLSGSLESVPGVTLTTLAGGFIEATYAGSTDYDIYDAKGDHVFTSNAWSTSGSGFTALDDGGYVLSRAGAGAFYFVDPSGDLNLASLPVDAPAGDPASFEALMGGGFLIQYAGSTHFDLYDASGHQVGRGELGAVLSSGPTAFTALSGGGFEEVWLTAGASGSGLSLEVQAFDASGHALGAAQTLAQGLDPTSTHLQIQAHPDGSAAVLWSADGTIYGAETSGGAAGAAYSTGIAAGLSEVQTLQLQNDKVALAYVQGGQLWVELFDPATGQTVQTSLGAATGDISTAHLLATDAGGLAVSWHDGSATMASVVSSTGTASAAGPIVGDLAGVDAAGDPVAVQLDAYGGASQQAYQLADGQHVWTPVLSSSSDTGGSTGGDTGGNTGGGNTGGGSGSDAETIAASGGPAALGSPGFTSAVILSNHDIAAVEVTPTNSGEIGHVTVSDASGAELGSVQLQGYAVPGQTLSPTITALAGGFFEVSYPDSSNYEVYNSSDQLVFNYNEWSPAGQGFTALTDGDYLVSRPDSNVLGLVDTSGAVSWITAASDAPAGVVPTIEALQGGGFALTFAGSGHFELYNASGAQVVQGELGASMLGFATAFMATADGGFAEAWLSTDGGQNGLPSSLDVQLVNAAGASSGVVTLTQDVDPWHTQLALQAHADGSVAALWSQGGAIWASEVANGAAGQAFAVGVAGSLSSVEAIQLPNDQVGFAFLQGGDVWAEIFNPTTGSRQVADLGAATGDLSSVHALATANGGVAVTWHDGASVLASVLSASGQASAPVAIAGDFLGVDASGHAVTVNAETTGARGVLQAYAINDTLFWHA